MVFPTQNGPSVLQDWFFCRKVVARLAVFRANVEHDFDDGDHLPAIGFKELSVLPDGQAMVRDPSSLC